MSVTVAIIDDEPIARDRVRRIIAGDPRLRIVGHAGGVDDAVKLLNVHKPDLVFLDIQMPGGDGFEVLRRVRPIMPEVVFVTAFDHHAVRAFAEAAVDYITKPVQAERVKEAVDRAIARFQARSHAVRLLDLEAALEVVRTELRDQHIKDLWFWIRKKDSYLKVNALDVQALFADGEYTRIVTADQSHLFDERLSAVEVRLPSTEFTRIHRKAIVRRSAVVAFEKEDFSGLVAILKNGDKVRVGRTFLKSVRIELGTDRDRPSKLSL